MLQSRAEEQLIDISASSKSASVTHLLDAINIVANKIATSENDTLIIAISFSCVARKIASETNGMSERITEIVVNMILAVFFSKLCNQYANIFSSQQLKSIHMICSRHENNFPPIAIHTHTPTLLRGIVIGAEIANQGTRTLNLYLYEIWPTETWVEMKTL